MTHEAVVALVNLGGRVTGGHSLHAEEKPDPWCKHAYRTLLCDFNLDILECAQCGKQRVARCDFDEEYA